MNANKRPAKSAELTSFPVLTANDPMQVHMIFASGTFPATQSFRSRDSGETEGKTRAMMSG
jgi:hypothetical protein